jgi:heat-inducible transcriptional repressor
MRAHVLEPRARELLRHIVHNYILTGEPVGSRTIAKLSREGISPASVRNVMADLEEMGYLNQPHTSSGRVPTDKGYRYYVDSLLPEGRVGSRDRALIDQNFGKVKGEVSEVMEVIPKLLSRLTSQVGYLISPPISEVRFKHIEFVRLHERRILVVFVDRSELVSHRILDMEEDYAQHDLDRAGRYLIKEFSGLTLHEIRGRLVQLMAEEKAAVDRLLSNAITLGTSYLEAETEERHMLLDGATNIMKHPELSDTETVRRLFETFEEKHDLVKLLDRCLDPTGPRVLIGSESSEPALGGLSLVASPYWYTDGATGWVGVLGPTRMEYDRALALVVYISRLFSSLLTHPSA